MLSAQLTQSACCACRNSKLTMLLQDSLGGDAKALMIANLSPSPAHAPETLSSLVFASKVQNHESLTWVNPTSTTVLACWTSNASPSGCSDIIVSMTYQFNCWCSASATQVANVVLKTPQRKFEDTGNGQQAKGSAAAPTTSAAGRAGGDASKRGPNPTSSNGGAPSRLRQPGAPGLADRGVARRTT